MTQESRLYEGSIRHRRMSPKVHEFTYPIFFSFLDLAELETDESPVMSQCRKRFRRSDHFGDPTISLSEAVREIVQENSGIVIDGPICMLAHLRSGGYVMNPATFYYCFDKSRSEVKALVVEVHNTPWNETHCYVLSGKNLQKSAMFTLQKNFHVSPFMPMDQEYRWTFGYPGEKLSVHMQTFSEEQKVFDATLNLRRKDLTESNWKYLESKHRFMTYKVISWIYLNAFHLWRKGIRVFSHPKKLERKKPLRCDQ